MDLEDKVIAVKDFIWKEEWLKIYDIAIRFKKRKELAQNIRKCKEVILGIKMGYNCK